MSSFIAFTIFGLYSGAAYAIAASGLVLTYSTTRVFNVAHGAFGMLLSFVFWDFSVRQGLPTWLAIVLVLFVVAPAIGWFISRFVARGLGDSPVSVSLVVTVALLVLCIGVAQQLYPADTSRTLLGFFPGKSFHVGTAVVTVHQLITILASIAVAAGLYLLLNHTRIGTAMRASVDNPELLRLFGGKPDQVAALSWMIGISLAGLGGILLAPVVGLDTFSLTLLVINAYAAATLGRLTSLPLSFLGAMGLGLLTSYLPAYGPTDGLLGRLQFAAPAIFLFVVVIAAPQAQLRIGQIKGIVSAPLPSAPKALGWGAGYLVVIALMAGAMAEPNLLRTGTALFAGMLILSMVLLTGYGGHVSLAQFSFAGVGALAYAKLRPSRPLRAPRRSPRRRPGRRTGRAAGAPADRALSRAGDAGVRGDHGQGRLPGRLRLRLQRRAHRPSALRHQLATHRAVRRRDGAVLRRDVLRPAAAPARPDRADADRAA